MCSRKSSTCVSRSSNDLDQRDRQLAELRQNLTANNAKLAEAQTAQAEIIRKSRELDDAKREIELTVEKKVQENLSAVRDKAKLEAEEALKAKVSEKEAQIAGMQRQIEDLQRKANQGSQQLQGESALIHWARQASLCTDRAAVRHCRLSDS